MARYCSAQDNVRTRQSPPYRETIRANVLHGRKSMSWAKSVLPLFTGTSSETFRKVPDRVQIDTTLVRQNRVQNHALIRRHRLLNRTAVMPDYDYIIVGGGSAGCVMANRLSEDPHAQVLLLEAGPPDDSMWIDIPVGFMKLLNNPRYSWRFDTEPEPNLNGRSLPVPRGKTLGGSSSINGMVYVRGNPLDYDTWAQFGNRGWS